MDIVNKAVAQAADLFKSLSPGARLCAGLLLVVTAVSVAYLFVEQSGGGDGYLMGGEMFSAAQLRNMHAALGKAGVEARIDGARIKVGRGQESKCMAALAEAGALPVEFGGYLEKAVTANSFLTLSRNQDAAMKIAKQRELQSIINTMVDKSLVLIDEQSDHGFPPKTIITASVSIQPRDRHPLDENRIPAAIRYLVASSVAGLKPQSVTVVDLSTQRTYPGTGGGDNQAPGALGDYAELKRYYEREYQEKISRLLAPYIPGVLVTTSVELDAAALVEQPSGSYDPAHVAAGERGDAPRAIQVVNSLAEPAEVAPQGLKQPGRGRHKPTDDSSQPPKRQSSAGERHAQRDGRLPRRVAVSVAVPNAHYERVWRQTTLAAAADPAKRPEPGMLAAIQATEKKKIEELVNPLLPKAEGNDQTAHVSVSTFYQFAEEPAREATLEENAWAWLSQNANTLGLAALVLLGLITVRSTIKAVHAPAETVSAPTLDLSSSLGLEADAGSHAPSEGPPQPHLRARAGRGPSLRDELSDIVRDDPEAAVSILRTWIGNSS